MEEVLVKDALIFWSIFFSILNYLTETDYYLWWFADSSMMRLSAEHVSISKTLLCMFCIYLRLQICASTVKHTSVFFGCQISRSLFNLLKVKKCLLLMPFTLHGMCSDTYLIPLDWFCNCWFCIVHVRRALESSAVSPQRALRASSVTLSCSALCSVEKFSSLGLWECGGGTDPPCVCVW